MSKKKILIAAGGTGGHLFPAQALARDLLQQDVEILFIGGDLNSNRCFNKELFAFQEISSATLKSPIKILKGIWQGMRILSTFKPDLVVGFGSFHAFPALAAAFFKRVPIVLFESNSFPGKVNRIFSRWAKISAVQFSEAAKHLKGKTVEVNMPVWQTQLPSQDPFAYFSLDPHKKTLLVFGGSQGAHAINRVFCEAVSLIQEKDFQVIHLTGKSQNVEEIKRHYHNLGISACVKEFENQMPLAWKAADLAICRSGAATLSELAAFEVPSILIPFPYAADDHQKKNALFMQSHVGGALHLDERELSAEKLYLSIQKMQEPAQLEKTREKIRLFNNQINKPDLSTLIFQYL